MQIDHSLQQVEVVALDLDPSIVLDALTPVREVVRRMREARSGCALITRNERLAGIFTERDFLLKIVGVKGALDRPVCESMTPNPITLGEREAVRRAVFHMHHQGFRNVPIVDEQGRVVNCVRQKDIVRFLAEHFTDRVLNLPPDPAQVARCPEGG